MSETLFLKLDATEHSHVTRQRERDEWDRDSTASEWTIDGLRFVKESEHWDFCTKTKQDKYWVVLEYYDTGDSFGRTENMMAPQYLAHERGEAEEVVKHLLAAIKAEKYNAEFEDPHTGKKISLNCNSVGYFERLVGIDVLEMDVGARTRYTLDD